MPALEPIGQFEDFSLFWGHCALDADMRARVQRFWAETGAIPDAREAWRRSFEVGCIVINGRGDVVGVSSFYIDRLAPDAATWWFYRTFLRADSRRFGLSTRVLNATAAQLRRRYGGQAGVPDGIVAVLENPRLESRAAVRHMQRQGFCRIGQDQQGRSVWRLAFDAIAPPPR